MRQKASLYVKRSCETSVAVSSIIPRVFVEFNSQVCVISNHKKQSHFDESDANRKLTRISIFVYVIGPGIALRNAAAETVVTETEVRVVASDAVNVVTNRETAVVEATAEEADPTAETLEEATIRTILGDEAIAIVVAAVTIDAVQAEVTPQRAVADDVAATEIWAMTAEAQIAGHQ